MKKARKLYESTTGDRWYLIREPSGGVFVRHESSDGEIEHVEIGAFLGGDGPEQQALLGLIGTSTSARGHAGPNRLTRCVDPHRP